MINLLILKGGNSLEKEISLKSFENVYKNINKEKYNIKILEIENFKSIEFIKEIEKFEPKIVLNLLHGGYGEDGTIQGFLSMLDIKYIGSKALSSGICMDKNLAKCILKANNIPTVEQVFIKKDEDAKIYEREIEQLSYPVILKPNCGGGSIGISIAKNIDETFKAIEKIKHIKDDILIEKFIYGKEVTCGVIQNKEGLFVLPVLDINTENTFFDYLAKYKQDTHINFSKLPKFLQTMIQEVAKKAFIVLKCEGYANVDFIIKEEEIYVLEINTLPGLTKKSLLPKAIGLVDKNMEQFLDEMIDFTLSR